MSAEIILSCAITVFHKAKISNQFTVTSFARMSSMQLRINCIDSSQSGFTDFAKHVIELKINNLFVIRL